MAGAASDHARRSAWVFDLAIELVLTLRLVLHPALRQAEAFTGTRLRLLGLALSVPDHTTRSRRARTVAKRQPRASRHDGPFHLVLDSAGLQLFGQGEWDAEKQRVTGYGRRNLVETAISRYKHLIAPKLRARMLPAQRGEGAIALAVPSRMARMAKPVSIQQA